MGYSIAWLAVQTSDHAALFEVARVHPTDEPDEAFEAPIGGAALNNGWFLLVGQGSINRLIEPSLLQLVSKRWPCIACSAEEHVMCSAVSYWRDGAEVWGVLHDTPTAIDHLQVSGKPPASFEELRQSNLRRQAAGGDASAGADAFEIPLLLAKGITGFKHDEAPTNLAQPMPVVFVDEQPARPWWKFW